MNEVVITGADIEAACLFLESWEAGPEMTQVKLARAFALHRLKERDATIAPLEAAPREFLDAARYDPHMDGSSTFMGWKQSDRRRAETRVWGALKGTTP